MKLTPETKDAIRNAAAELDRTAVEFGQAVAAFREAILLGGKEAAAAGLGRQFIGTFGWSHTNRNIEARLQEEGVVVELHLSRITGRPEPGALDFRQKIEALLEKT